MFHSTDEDRRREEKWGGDFFKKSVICFSNTAIYANLFSNDIALEVLYNGQL